MICAGLDKVISVQIQGIDGSTNGGEVVTKNDMPLTSNATSVQIMNQDDLKRMLARKTKELIMHMLWYPTQCLHTILQLWFQDIDSKPPHKCLLHEGSWKASLCEQFNRSKVMPLFWDMVMQIHNIIKRKWPKIQANLVRPVEHGILICIRPKNTIVRMIVFNVHIKLGGKTFKIMLSIDSIIVIERHLVLMVKV
eukprot:5983716-Ditylum_brightwellii.AAC.2